VIALLEVRMAHANRRSGGPFFDRIAAVQDFVLDFAPEPSLTNELQKTG
jgi:hypothetical protein